MDEVAVDRRERNPGPSVLLTVEEAAVLLRRGDIQSVKIGRRRLVLRAGVQEFVDGLLEE